jgi:predicted protein tyrosine phosphatase
MEHKTINVLFICSRNRWRSPTAENVYAKHDQLNTRSRGTSSKAARTVSSNDVRWADIILVMESKHRQLLKSKFPAEMRCSQVHVLDIQDDYQFMDPELIQVIRDSVDPLIARRSE